MRVIGIDAAPGGWAVVFQRDQALGIRKIPTLGALSDWGRDYQLIAIDIPIGLIDCYEIGGRICDRTARALLRNRGSSVFPPPVRSVLKASSYPEACAISRASSPFNKAISQQAYNIIPKIREVDKLLRSNFNLRSIVREVHPEVCFRELVGAPMAHSKRKRAGREERRTALRGVFPDFDALEVSGRAQNIPVEDILDAAVACWSAQRLARGQGRSLAETIPIDSAGLAMAIWV